MRDIDVDLQVVEKEFKEHVNDMQKLGKEMKEKRDSNIVFVEDTKR